MLIKQHASDDLNSSDWSVSFGFAEKRMKAEIRETNQLTKRSSFSQRSLPKGPIKKSKLLVCKRCSFNKRNDQSCPRWLTIFFRLPSLQTTKWRSSVYLKLCRKRRGKTVAYQNFFFYNSWAKNQYKCVNYLRVCL